MPRIDAIRHSPAVRDTEFEFVLVLASMLVLAVMLVYFFPTHDDANSWQPEAATHVLGP